MKLNVLILFFLLHSQIVWSQPKIELDYSIDDFEILPNNSFIIANFDQVRLERYSQKGKIEFGLGNLNGLIDPIQSISDIHLGGGLKLLITDDENDQIILLDRNFQLLGQISIQSIPQKTDWEITHAVSTLTGEIWVFNHLDQSLIRFDENGLFRTEVFIPSGIQIENITDIQISDETIHILDADHQIIYQFSLIGKYLNWIKIPSEVKSLQLAGKNWLAFYKNQIAIYDLGLKMTIQLIGTPFDSISAIKTTREKFWLAESNKLYEIPKK